MRPCPRECIVTMAHSHWVRRYGAQYPGEWCAVRDDKTVDHDVDRVALMLRLDESDERGVYLIRVPDRKRS